MNTKLVIEREMLDQSNLLDESTSGGVIGTCILGLTLLDESVESPEVTLPLSALMEERNIPILKQPRWN